MLGVHVGWIVALVLVVLVYVYMKHSKQGYELSIVGENEADPYQKKISTESPIGNGLLGTTVGEVVTIEIPKGVIEYKVLNIRR